MKKMLNKLALAAMAVVTTFSNVALAVEEGSKVNTTKLNEALGDLRGTIFDIVTPVGGLVIFMSVLMVGFAIIKNKDKADDRMKSMESLLWVGIGAFILGSALLLTPAIAGLLGAQSGS